ncbi:hypothetical protein SteCoe_32916 [Stentor coeruleus]|uniref:Uncharacterized protein n=1 Tax=Stentor coeruleus TaxID=5963 RepID=A0A1R2AY19_9CILI|nr:hypothetical protein SteCoe_32916 [Stentor coeruleus]
MDEKIPVIVGNKHHRRVVSLPIHNYGIEQKPKGLIKKAPERLFLKSRAGLNNTINLSKTSSSNKTFVNKICISSKIALGLTYISKKPVPVRIPDNKFMQTVLSESKIIKKHKKDMRCSILSFVNYGLERKKNLGASLMNTFSEDYLKNILKGYDNFDREANGLKPYNLLPPISNTFDRVDEESLSNNSLGVDSSIYPNISNSSQINSNTLSLSPDDKAKPLKKNSSGEEYSYYKKKFKIRPRYSTVLKYED